MSDVTFEIRFMKDGALFDPTSVVLSDAAPAYGVKETVAGTVVVAAATATVNDAVGIYSYTYESAVAGRSYTASFKYVIKGVTHYDTKEETAASAGNGLSLTYADLLGEVAAYLGYGVDSTAWTADQTTEIDRYVQSGVRQFYYPPKVEGVQAGYEWSFIKPTTTIDTVDGDGEQDLPDALGRVIGDFYYEADEYKASVVIVSEAMVLAARSRTDDESYPRIAAVRHKSQVADAEQRLEVVWAPVPDSAYTLTYRYEAFSGKVSDANSYPLGGMKHAELLIESCLAIAEQKANDERGIHTDNFKTLLADGVARDRKQGARYFGPMSPGPEKAPGRFYGVTNYPITHDGVTW